MQLLAHGNHTIPTSARLCAASSSVRLARLAQSRVLEDGRLKRTFGRPPHFDPLILFPIYNTRDDNNVNNSNSHVGWLQPHL